MKYELKKVSSTVTNNEQKVIISKMQKQKQTYFTLKDNETPNYWKHLKFFVFWYISVPLI